MNKPIDKVCCLVAFFSVASSLLIFTGCGGGHAIIDGSGPEVTALTINPRQLARFVGGQVVITAIVSDASGVKKVTARVVRQNDGQLLAEVKLQRVAADRFEVTIAAPANTRDDGQDEVYTVTIIATDKAGQKTRMGDGTFTVLAPGGPPPPPNP